MHTVCVSVQSENRSRSLGPKNKIEDEESEREREKREKRREREREREAILQLEASPNVSLKFVETPWLSYILWNNGLGRENNRFTNEQRLLR